MPLATDFAAVVEVEGQRRLLGAMAAAVEPGQMTILSLINLIVDSIRACSDHYLTWERA
ncbi:hypothetical protein PLESTM_001635700 [Pleodorina starrii]|nr:hypothetical protein PLESTM_001635700 [Pleodorina starrii]